jgi:hypothetical protein
MTVAAVLKIFKARSGFEIVSFFAMLGDIKAFDFFGFTYAHTGDHIRYFQEHNGADERKAPGDQNAYELIAELSPVAVQTADWFACAENRIDELLSENAG